MKITIKEIVDLVIEESKQEGKKLTKKEIADYLGISRQNFVNKLTRNTFTPEEIAKIAEKLDCKLVMKGNNKEYIVTY